MHRNVNSGADTHAHAHKHTTLYTYLLFKQPSNSSIWRTQNPMRTAPALVILCRYAVCLAILFGGRKRACVHACMFDGDTFEGHARTHSHSHTQSHTHRHRAIQPSQWRYSHTAAVVCGVVGAIVPHVRVISGSHLVRVCACERDRECVRVCLCISCWATTKSTNGSPRVEHANTGHTGLMHFMSGSR